MDNQILTQEQPVVNLLADGVHEYDDPKDRYVVVVDGEEVAWAGDKATAERSYTEMLRVNGEHLRNPANAIPESWFTINTIDYVAGVNRETGEVVYRDHRR